MSEGILPSSFETRGFSLPLTTPLFTHSRLVRAKGALAVSIPSFEKAGYCYQVPLDKMAALPDLTVFDHALLEKLEFISEPDPYEIENLAAEVELTGLNGAVAMRLRRAEEERGHPATDIRSLVADMEELADDLRRWLINEPVDSAELAQRTALALTHTVKVAKAWIKAWEKKAGEDQPLPRELQRELDFLMDGWPRILSNWNATRTADAYLQRETLIGFFPYLPVLPANVAGKGADFWEGLLRVQLRWARRSPLAEELGEAGRSALAQHMRAPS